MPIFEAKALVDPDSGTIVIEADYFTVVGEGVIFWKERSHASDRACGFLPHRGLFTVIRKEEEDDE